MFISDSGPSCRYIVEQGEKLSWLLFDHEYLKVEMARFERTPQVPGRNHTFLSKPGHIREFASQLKVRPNRE